MFQYALYKSLRKRGKHAVIDSTTYLKAWKTAAMPLYNAFRFKECRIRTVPEFFKRNAIKIGEKTFLRRYREEDFETSWKTIMNSHFLSLKGYWQSEKYFSEKDVQDELRRDFATPREFWDSDCFVRWHRMITQSKAASIHFRRGDYLSGGNVELYDGICTPEYYRRAIDLVLDREPETVFYCFSDDKEYARQFADGSRFILVEDEELSDKQELYLMSYCRNHILANSSYSWWGAWLNEQDGAVVVAPGRWLNTSDSEEIYRDNMIRITDL